jgi:hypothetical protein
VRRRLAVGPDTLLERTAQLRPVRLAHEVATLMVERRVQEEAVVLKREVLVGLADSALAERHELLAFGKRAHGDGPLLKCDWHREGSKISRKSGCALPFGGSSHPALFSSPTNATPVSDRHILCTKSRNRKTALQIPDIG